MATRANTTRVLGRAPSNVVSFPDTPVCQARREINERNTERAINRWNRKKRKLYGHLSAQDQAIIGVHLVERLSVINGVC